MKATPFRALIHFISGSDLFEQYCIESSWSCRRHGGPMALTPPIDGIQSDQNCSSPLGVWGQMLWKWRKLVSFRTQCLRGYVVLAQRPRQWFCVWPTIFRTNKSELQYEHRVVCAGVALWYRLNDVPQFGHRNSEQKSWCMPFGDSISMVFLFDRADVNARKYCECDLIPSPVAQRMNAEQRNCNYSMTQFGDCPGVFCWATAVVYNLVAARHACAVLFGICCLEMSAQCCYYFVGVWYCTLPTTYWHYLCQQQIGIIYANFGQLLIYIGISCANIKRDLC